MRLAIHACYRYLPIGRQVRQLDTLNAKKVGYAYFFIFTAALFCTAFFFRVLMHVVQSAMCLPSIQRF